MSKLFVVVLLVAPVRQEQRVALTADDQATLAKDPDLRKRVNIPRSTVPAIRMLGSEPMRSPSRFSNTWVTACRP